MSTAQVDPAAVDAAEVSARYRRIAAGYRARVGGLGQQDWGRPTPCPEWTVRDLVAHSVAVHRRMLTRLSGGELPSIEPAAAGPGEDLPAEVAEVTAALQRALEDPACAGLTVETPAGPGPFAGLIGTLLCGDTLIHTWDLARASGQDERLDPPSVETTLRFMLARDERDIRAPGRFGTRLDAPAGADAQTQLLLFCGRSV